MLKLQTDVDQSEDEEQQLNEDEDDIEYSEKSPTTSITNNKTPKKNVLLLAFLKKNQIEILL